MVSVPLKQLYILSIVIEIRELTDRNVPTHMIFFLAVCKKRIE